MTDCVASRLRAAFSRHQPVRYVLIGFINTAFSFGVYCGGIAMGWSIPAASMVALVLGILFSFSTQGAVVFGNLSRKAFVLFTVNWAAMYGLHVGIVLAAGTQGINPYGGGALAMVVTTTISYFVLKRFVFRAASRHN